MPAGILLLLALLRAVSAGEEDTKLESAHLVGYAGRIAYDCSGTEHFSCLCMRALCGWVVGRGLTGAHGQGCIKTRSWQYLHASVAGRVVRQRGMMY